MGLADRTARAALGRASLLLGWLPLSALVVVTLAAGEIPATYQYLPLVASAVILGMPHGGADLVALPRARTGRVDVRGVAVVGLLYPVAGGAYLALWFVAPVVAAVAFLGLTWFHWGQGDLYVLRGLVPADHVDDWPQQALTVLVRGGVPMVVPLVAVPETYRRVVATFVAPFGGIVGSWWVFGPRSRLVLAGILGTITIVTLARGYTRTTERRGWRLDAAETTFLWVFFLLVPPVLAVGAYFCLWHSLRHVARVVLLDDRSVQDLAGRRWLPPLGRFTLEAGGPTALALGFVAVLWWTVPPPETSVAGVIGLYLAAVAVLTLPHTVVVLVLDYQQSVWAWPTD